MASAAAFSLKAPTWMVRRLMGEGSDFAARAVAAGFGVALVVGLGAGFGVALTGAAGVTDRVG